MVQAVILYLWKRKHKYIFISANKNVLFAETTASTDIKFIVSLRMYGIRFSYSFLLNFYDTFAILYTIVRTVYAC